MFVSSYFYYISVPSSPATVYSCSLYVQYYSKPNEACDLGCVKRKFVLSVFVSSYFYYISVPSSSATVYNSNGVLLSNAVTKGTIAIPLREQESWKKITIHFTSDRGTNLPRCIPASLSRLAREVRSFDQRDLVCRFRSLSNTRALLHLQQDSPG